MNVYFKNGSKFVSIYDLVYPVGAVYCTTSGTKPASSFGGTWIQITGRFLVGMGGAGTSNTEDHFGSTTGFAGWEHTTVGATGGNGWVTLTTSQIPSHNHSCGSAGAHTHTAQSAGGHTHSVTLHRFNNTWNGLSHPQANPFGNNTILTTSSSGIANASYTTSSNGSHTHKTDSQGSHTHTIGNSGGNGSHSNMPPYYVVYMWRRTA